MGISSTTPFEWSSHGRHSWSFAHVAPGPDSARMNRLIPQATDHYAHAYVFPNLFVSLTSGLVAYVAHFIPDRPDRTVLHYQLHETPLLMRQSQGVRDFVKSRSIEFTEKVLAEDLELWVCPKPAWSARMPDIRSSREWSPASPTSMPATGRPCMLPNEHPVLVTGATSGISWPRPAISMPTTPGLWHWAGLLAPGRGCPDDAPGDCSACDST
jgi:hypothetical protein